MFEDWARRVSLSADVSVLHSTSFCYQPKPSVWILVMQRLRLEEIPDVACVHSCRRSSCLRALLDNGYGLPIAGSRTSLVAHGSLPKPPLRYTQGSRDVVTSKGLDVYSRCLGADFAPSLCRFPSRPDAGSPGQESERQSIAPEFMSHFVYEHAHRCVDTRHIGRV